MEVKIKTEPFEYIEISNVYSRDELSTMHAEFTFLNKTGALLPPEKSGSATDAGGNYKKRNHAVFLDEVYTDRDTSSVLRHNRKLFELEISFAELSPVFKALKYSNKDTTLLSYYEDGDYYHSHVDDSMLTALTYFYEKPKLFSGGELVFPEYGCTLEPTYNTTYIFCSMVEHAVTPVVMGSGSENQGLGRYCMAQFLRFT